MDAFLVHCNIYLNMNKIFCLQTLRHAGVSEWGLGTSRPTLCYIAAYVFLSIWSFFAVFVNKEIYTLLSVSFRIENSQLNVLTASVATISCSARVQKAIVTSSE